MLAIGIANPMFCVGASPDVLVAAAVFMPMT